MITEQEEVAMRSEQESEGGRRSHLSLGDNICRDT